MNKATMRTNVRRDLKDEDSGNYRWTDNEVDRVVDRALREYSRVKPNELKATFATTSGSRTVSLSSISSVVAIFAVEFPIDKFPRQYQRFTWFAGSVELLGDNQGDGANSYVYYGKVHDIDATTWTVDVQHEHIIALGAVAYALLQYGGYAVNRVNVGGDRSAADALKWGRQKLQEFEAELKRLANKVKTSKLYVPAIPGNSQSTDWGT